MYTGNNLDNYDKGKLILMLQVRQVISLVTSHPYLHFCRHIIPILNFISIENIFGCPSFGWIATDWYKFCKIRHMPTLHREYYRTLWLLWINRKNWRFFTGARNWLPLRIKGQKSDGRLQIWCSIQLSLHKEPPEVGLVKKVNRKFVLVGDTTRANPT